MRRFSSILLVLWAIPCYPDSYPRQPGVDAIHYDIGVELGEASDSVSGTTRAHLMMRQDDLARAWLDFEGMTVDALTIAGTEANYTHAGGRLAFDFDPRPRRGQIVTIEVRYHGRPGAAGLLIQNNGIGRRVYFAENWPDRAHYWFPCIDHPSDKATADITVTAPERYDVVAPGALVETRSQLDGRKATHWSEKVPVPTYSMVFGAAEFSVRNAGTVRGIPISYYAYPPDAAVAARRFDRSNLAMEFLAGRVGPYPFEKLAHVEATTRIGGMENASAIFYAESWFHERTPKESVIPHEIAHQWFGDSVTEADWDHLWLSEGFATYFEALFYEHLEGPESLKRSMARAAEAIATFHKLHPAPVIDPETRELPKKLNALNYQKGAWILHMLRKIVGDEAFFNGIRRYYNLYAGRSVVSEDFERVMDSVSGTPLAGFFHQWLYQPGCPQYRVSWTWNEAAGVVDLTVRQTQATGLFDMPIEIGFQFGNRRELHTIRVSSESHSVRIPLQTRPAAVELDPDGWILKSCTVERR